VCVGTTQSPAPACPCPFFLLSFPFLLFLAAYPEAVSGFHYCCSEHRSCGSLRVATLQKSHCEGSVPEWPWLCPAQWVSRSGISQPAVKLRCNLCQDARSACDCLNPSWSLKLTLKTNIVNCKEKNRLPKILPIYIKTCKNAVISLSWPLFRCFCKCDSDKHFQVITNFKDKSEAQQ